MRRPPGQLLQAARLAEASSARPEAANTGPLLPRETAFTAHSMVIMCSMSPGHRVGTLKPRPADPGSSTTDSGQQPASDRLACKADAWAERPTVP
jgi:hypothetical protein